MDIFDFVNESIWNDKTSKEEVSLACEKAFQDLSKEITKRKTVYRLCGQSGSGKTTQLLSSLTKSLEGEKPAVVAVRNFSYYHPKYQYLLEKYGRSKIREITNGFALKCLFLTLEKLLKEGYLIIYEVSILEEKYEKLLLEMFRKYDYQIDYQIISVSKKISDYFIEKRKLSSESEEKGRIILENSSLYFYNSSYEGLKYLIKEDGNSKCVIWSVFYPFPVYMGLLKNCKNIFDTYRNVQGCQFNNEDYLRNSKISFFKDYLVNNG